MTWDNTYLYVAVAGPNATDPISIYFDTDPDGNTGVPATSGLAIYLPFKADAEVSIGTTPEMRLAVSNGGTQTWGPVTGTSAPGGTITMATINNTREVRIPWARFYGTTPTPVLPAAFGWQGYVTTGGVRTNSVPAANVAGPNYTYYYSVNNTDPVSPQVVRPFQQMSYTSPLGDATNTLALGTYYDVVLTGAAKNLAGNITVRHAFSVSNLTLSTTDVPANVNKYSINLDPTATFSELGTGYVLGTVQMQNRPITSQGAFGFGGAGTTTDRGMGLQLQITSIAVPGNTTVRRLTGIRASGNGHQGIARVFEIRPTNLENVSASLTFFYRDSENSAPEGQLALFKAPALDGPWTLIGRDSRDSNAGANLVNFDNVSLNGFWTLSDQRNPLPVELAQFTGQASAAGVQLQWTTASEKQNEGFDVERQTASGSWLTLGFVKGQGNSTKTTAYSYLDRTAPQGASLYYRLHQKNTDGTSAYSPIVAVQPDAFASSNALSMSPIPAVNTLNINYLSNSVSTVDVYNLLGQRVLHQAVSGSTTELSVAGLPAGIYVVQAAGAGSRLQKARFVKQ
ncbi:T9SS type A sorting domain-containing protein [Hymenobacter sp. BT491]|uniref:T9SS type A sorting domain-containing protein n=1 Tax=Hymenobacter sp. BT491 TaxID=2766779 RepID=UPI0016535026|nr:T9SS type A sorting domain-containing protein [Hymenobacter sp. BT491]MBC6988460.1 T9SS type A sorting domain-containing protein [Hymenobacter sp. BT491]